MGRGLPAIAVISQTPKSRLLNWNAWYLLGSLGLGSCIAAGVLLRDACKQASGVAPVPRGSGGGSRGQPLGR